MNILIVDPQKSSFLSYVKPLDKNYNVEVCADINAVAERLQNLDNGAVLIVDPGISGAEAFSLCGEIKSQHNKHQVLFLSSFDNEDDLLAAYQSGADDYIVQPCSEALLLARIGLLKDKMERLKSVEQQVKDVEGLAFRSMKEISEYGLILRLVRDSLSINSIEDIINCFYDYIGEFGLQCSVQIRSGYKTISKLNKTTNCSCVEQEVFDLLKDRGRIYTFNDRMMINFPQASILLKGLPECELDVGRYQDLFCLLVEIIDAKVVDIEREQSVIASQNMVKQVCHSISDKLGNSSDEQDSTQLSNIANAIESMERAFDFMDLSNSEEKMFRDLFDTYYAEFENLSTFLTGIMSQLNKMELVLKNDRMTEA